MQFLQKTNSITVSRFVLDSLSLLNMEYDNILSCITDGAAYVSKAVQSLQFLMPNMIHVNCLAQNLQPNGRKSYGKFS